MFATSIANLWLVAGISETAHIVLKEFLRRFEQFDLLEVVTGPKTEL